MTIFAYRSGLKDQDVLNFFLQNSTGVASVWRLLPFNVTCHILEPALAPTGSVLFCRGRQMLAQQAAKLGQSQPVAVHLNWHRYVQGKVRTLRLLGWQVNTTKCHYFSWHFWTTRPLPRELTCYGNLVGGYDVLDRRERLVPYLERDRSFLSLVSFWLQEALKFVKNLASMCRAKWRLWGRVKEVKVQM